MPLQIVNYKYSFMLVLVFFLLSLPGLNSYQGSVFYYLAFDLSWLLVLFSTLCCSQTYVICYIQIMLFLGFWMKLMANLVLDAVFVEPTGYWTSAFASPDAWDRVLLISSFAACGILLANLVLFFSTNKRLQSKNAVNPPQWYLQHSNFIWYLLVFLGITLDVINFVCRISVTGLRPQIVLPFHLNALMIWGMIIVIPLCMAAFLGWELDPLQKKKRFYWVCFMAFSTALSVLSRAIYIFWTLPYLLLLISDANFSLRKLSFSENRRLILTYFMFAALSLILVSVIRIHFYTATPISILAHSKEKRVFPELKQLVVGRWVGMEALMATTAFPQSNWLFFKRSILEKPSVGDVGCYTREVLRLNKYVNAAPKTMFSSLPGLVGILNYAHSRFLVLFGTFAVCLLLCFIERISFFMLTNKVLLAQQGLILSYWCVSGLNIPYLGFINLLECFFVVLILKLMNPFYKWVTKLCAKRPSHAFSRII